MTALDLDSIKAHLADAAHWTAGSPGLVVQDAHALVAEVERLQAFVTDLADHGIRFDLSPTVAGTPGSYVYYLERIDKSIRERAAAVRESSDSSSIEGEQS